MAVNCERRTPSTSAPQSLMLMNSDFVRDHARAMADRVIAEAAGTSESRWPRRLTIAWELAYLRPIDVEEMSLAQSFIARQLDALGKEGKPEDRERAVLTNLCQQLLSSNEFLYVD